MSGSLSHYLFLACKEFFKAANSAQVPAVLIGGGALGMHGLLARRTTKDLDLNVGREILTKAFKSKIRIVEMKKDQDEPGTWLWREDRREDEIRQQVLDTLVTFSLRSEGIRFADLGPLVATKTLSVVQRGIGQVEKHKSDKEDFEMTIMTMIDRKQKMPEQVVKVLLKPTVLQAFLNLDVYKNYREYFVEIDVKVNEQAPSARIDAVESDGEDNQG